MANGIYEGGITEGNPDISIPPQDGGATQFQPAPGAGGEGRINPTKGGPANMNSSYKAQSGDVNFNDVPNYEFEGSGSIDDDPSMVIRNPDKISTSPTGGAQGMDY